MMKKWIVDKGDLLNDQPGLRNEEEGVKVR